MSPIEHDDEEPAKSSRVANQTIARPSPGGVFGQAAFEPSVRDFGLLIADTSSLGVNPLVNAAAELFNIVIYLRSQREPIEALTFQDKVIELIDRFRTRALTDGANAQDVKHATIAIAATIDDAVLIKPWAEETDWVRRKLVTALRVGSNLGGEDFFAFLAEAERDPERKSNLLEFLYLCIALGFEGQYRRERGEPRDENLESIRTKAFRTIRRARTGGFAEPLSIRWEGMNTRRRPISDLLPPWVLAALSVAFVLLLFVWFFWRVGGYIDEVATRTADLPPLSEEGLPLQRVSVAAAELPRARVEEPSSDPTPTVAERVRETFLGDARTRGLVEVEETGEGFLIIIKGEGMFDSARAVVKTQHLAALNVVAQELLKYPAKVVVEGHTDTDGSARMNMRLSEERAEAVKIILDAILPPGLTSTKAFGEQRPRASNNTAAGKATNRRVELRVIRPTREMNPDWADKWELVE